GDQQRSQPGRRTADLEQPGVSAEVKVPQRKPLIRVRWLRPEGMDGNAIAGHAVLRSRPAPQFLLEYGVSALPAGRRNHQMLQGLAGTPFPDQDERGTLGRSIVPQPGEQAVRQRLSGELQ